MSRIHYAIEVETEATVSSATYGITSGFFRLITDRPVYEGAATGGSTIPTGDNCAFTIALSGAQTIGVSFQSGGEIYAASNGTFKAANTVPTVGMRFTVGDDVDFDGGELATAKGSSSAEGDMFEVTNATSGSEAVRYVGVNRWYTDMITRDGMSNPSRSVDLELSGDYGTLSGFTFSVNGAIVAGTDTPLWSYIAAQSVALANKPVRLYAVIDDVFYQIWTGIVDRTNINETEFIFECKSNFKAVHRDLPPVTDLDGNTTPVCIGDVEYAKVIDLDISEPTYVDLVKTKLGFSKCAQATAYAAYSPITGSLTSITLKTTGKTIVAHELDGYYLFVANGAAVNGVSPDTENGILIVESWSAGANQITLTLSDVILGFNLAVSGYAGTDRKQNLWNFRIGRIGTSGIVSNYAIKSVKQDSVGKYLVYSYDDTKKDYGNIGQIVSSVTVATATIGISAPSISPDKVFNYYSPLSIEVGGCNIFVGPDNGGTVLSDAGWNPSTYAVLTDKDRTTKKEYEAYNVDVTKQTVIYMYHYLRVTDLAPFDVDKLALAVDATIRTVGNTAATISHTTAIYCTDQYGGTRFLDKFNASSYSYTHNVSETTKLVNMLPNSFYASGGDANGEDNIYAAVDDQIELSADSKTRLDGLTYDDYLILETVCTFPVITGENSYIYYDMKQIGLFAIKEINVSENIYARVSGEKLADASETNTVYTALRHILETYDKLTADELDYGNLATKRNNWYVGRQLTEPKNSADYILELCQQSFVAGFQNRKGKIAFSAWRDRTDTPHTHDHTAIIRDSITNWEPVSIDNIFNCFTLKYSYNPGADSYFSAYQIKDVDDAADEPTDADLSAMWQVCRAAYLQYKTIKEFKIDLSFFNDRTRWYNSTDAMVGIGVDSSAWKFLENAVFWMTRQRRNVQYSLPMSAANVVIELCDPVNFRDTIYTNAAVDSSYIRGAIHTLEYDLKTDTVIVGSILDPADTIDADFGDIIETGSQTDEIVESGSRTDEYEETGN